MVEDFKRYLEERHFDKTLKKLVNEYKDQTVVIYGTGMLFEAITQNYDLSGLNIVAVADRKFATTKPDEYLGFKTCAPDEIKTIKPDVVLVGTLRTVAIIENLRYELLLNTKIKVKSLVKRHLMEILKEIWC